MGLLQSKVHKFLTDMNKETWVKLNKDKYFENPHNLKYKYLDEALDQPSMPT